MRAAIYARYSSENQRPESIEDQVAACGRLASERGFRVLEDHVYADEAQSGRGAIGRAFRPWWPLRRAGSSSGYAGTPTTDVARAANLSRGAVQYRFADRDDVLHSFVNESIAGAGPQMSIRVENANVFDTRTLSVSGEHDVTIEGDRIVAVDPRGTARTTVDQVIDARGRYLLPGFIDAHVHHVIVTMNFAVLPLLSTTEKALGMARLAEATVKRGFTTVRDTGGDVNGLIRAIQSGLCLGPRIVAAGRALSQTGGHGDVLASADATCACQIHANDFSVIADGPSAVRLAARLALRGGSKFLKLMVSGGVASPTDPFESIQYTPEEILAATTESDHRQTYSTAHAYQPEAILPAIEAGVRCIEHGNLIDSACAEAMANRGVVMVPTLVVYRAMAEVGVQLGLPQRNIEKNEGVFEAGQRAIETAKHAGVELGFGTDLLGETQSKQSQEFAIRAELEPAEDVWRSMYQTNVRLCQLEGQIGEVAPGSSADLVLSSLEPIRDIAGFSDPEKSLDLIVCRGQIVVNRCS